MQSGLLRSSSLTIRRLAIANHAVRILGLIYPEVGLRML